MEKAKIHDIKEDILTDFFPGIDLEPQESWGLPTRV